MRFLMKITMPIEPFNSYVKDGSIGARMGKIMDDLKPEAIYFTADKGCRGATAVINLDNTSEIPAKAEPWFLMLNANIEFLPAMNGEDLANSGLEALGKKWS